MIEKAFMLLTLYLTIKLCPKEKLNSLSVKSFHP